MGKWKSIRKRGKWKSIRKKVEMNQEEG